VELLLQDQGGEPESAVEPSGTLEPTGEQSDGATGGPFGGMLFPLLLVLVVFYFVMIGPERKNRRRREELLKSLKKGDRVMTSSGMYGTIAQVQDDVVTLQVADGVRLRFTRQAIQGLEGEPASPAAPADAAEK